MPPDQQSLRNASVGQSGCGKTLSGPDDIRQEKLSKTGREMRDKAGVTPVAATDLKLVNAQQQWLGARHKHYLFDRTPCNAIKSAHMLNGHNPRFHAREQSFAEAPARVAISRLSRLPVVINNIIRITVLSRSG